MGLLDTVSDIVADVGPDRDAPDEPQSEGSYWCDDCGVRIRDVDHDGEGAPTCPDCGAAMRFERRTDSAGCAC